jgi:DNA-binding transcriptional regulator PaaX
MPSQDAAEQAGAAKTKIDAVIELLGRKNGASIEDIGAANGWQHHTVRAALSGLRKKGQAIARSKCGARSRYAISKRIAAGRRK